MQDTEQSTPQAVPLTEEKVITLEQYKSMTKEEIKQLPMADQIKLAKALREQEQGKARKKDVAAAAVTVHPKVVAHMKKLGRQAAKAAKQPAKKAASQPAKPKKLSKKAVAKPKAHKAVAHSKAGAHCSICGKSLERESSVKAGMGDVCQHKMKLLPKGMTLKEHYENLTEVEVPDGWIKLRDAAKKAQAKGVSIYRFVQAIGGDRMLRKPISKVFQVKIVKAVRYIDADCLKHLKELEKI